MCEGKCLAQFCNENNNAFEMLQIHLNTSPVSLKLLSLHWRSDLGNPQKALEPHIFSNLLWWLPELLSRALLGFTFLPFGDRTLCSKYSVKI